MRHLEVLIHEENRLRCRNALKPLQVPSTSTLGAFRKEVIGEAAYLVGTTGERNARNKRGRGSTDIRALLIGEYVEIDECKASLVVSAKACGRWESLGADERRIIEEIDREIRERLHILVMIDVATRMPLAWIVSDQPKAEATLALFRVATRSKAREARKFGCEGQAVLGIGIGHVKNDNGPGLRNSTAVAALMGIAEMNTVSRAYSPTERPYIERMFGTEESVLFRLIHGYTGRKPGDLPGYDAVENGVLDIEELMGILTRFMIDEYPAMRHTGVGMGGRRPIEVWNEINDVRGCFKPIDPRDRLIHLGWKQQVKPTDEGVKVFSGLWFDSDELRQALEGTKHSGKVTVFIDPDDVTRATVLVPKTPLPVTVTLQITAFADLTLPEVLELVEVWRREDPGMTEIYEDRLARIRRERLDQLRAIGVEKKLKRSYSTLEECLKKAQHLFAGARIIRNEPLPGTTPAGRITDMTPGARVFQIAGTDMLIEGKATSVAMSDVTARSRDDEANIVGTEYGRRPAEIKQTAVEAHSGSHRPTTEQRPIKQKPAAPTFGRPSKLRDLE